MSAYFVAIATNVILLWILVQGKCEAARKLWHSKKGNSTPKALRLLLRLSVQGQRKGKFVYSDVDRLFVGLRVTKKTAHV